MPIVEKNTKAEYELRIERKNKKRTKNLKEIILAFSLSPQGDHTDIYVREQLKEYRRKENFEYKNFLSRQRPFHRHGAGIFRQRHSQKCPKK